MKFFSKHNNIIPMSTRKFSLILAGLIWTLVGVRIGSRAIVWLEPYFDPPSWQLVFILISIVLGFFKADKVLRKSVERGISNTSKIDDSMLNYLIGWLKLYGARGVIVVLLMIGLGYFLRMLKYMGYDSYNIFGFLYLAVALSLIGASSWYFIAATKVDK